MIYQSITITNKHTVLFNFIVLFEVETQNNKRQKNTAVWRRTSIQLNLWQQKQIENNKEKQSIVTMATIQVGNLRSY